MMTKQKPQIILGYWRPPHITMQNVIDSAEWFVGLGNYPSDHIQSACRQADINSTVATLAFIHLGFEMPKPAEVYLNRGFDVAVEYFCGDWWKNAKGEKMVMDKKYHKKGRLEWIDPFHRGLLLGLLSERWEELSRICAWVESNILPGETFCDIESELVDLYRSLAAGLRPEPMPGLEEVEARILKSRKKRPKLLFQAWDAARSGNQDAFNNAFLKAIEHFELGFDPKSRELCSPILWIAIHHSNVALAAKRKGMKLPELTPKQEAFLMTRESLGLPSQ